MKYVLTRSVIQTLFLMFVLCIAAFFSVKFPLEPKYSIISSIVIMLFALPCYCGLTRTYGLLKSIVLITVMSLFAIILENIAVFTGIPYGRFSYGNMMGLTIGLVPLTVGFAWTPILFGAYGMSYYFYSGSKAVVRVGVSAIIMTLFDVVLDPGSVSLGYWKWEYTKGFYGVPWSNYLGWIFSSSVAVFILLVLLKSFKVEEHTSSKWIISSYILMLFYWIAIAFIQQLHGVYLFGLGILILFVLRFVPKNIRVIKKI